MDDDVVERFNRAPDAQEVRRLVQRTFTPEIARVLTVEIDTGVDFRWLTPQPRWLRLLQELRELAARLDDTEAVAA